MARTRVYLLMAALAAATLIPLAVPEMANASTGVYNGCLNGIGATVSCVQSRATAPMKIEIETSGGFAPLPALSKPITIDTTTIDPQLARQLESLVQDAAFFDRPAFSDTAAKGAADYRTYTITVQDDSRIHTVRFNDPIPDPSLERLVSRLRVISRPSKP